jgi:hypothetical protein
MVCSVGVDRISCGTGKRDLRIANPGPIGAYLGYGFVMKILKISDDRAGKRKLSLECEIFIALVRSL